MAYQPLTKEQYDRAISSGYSADAILQHEKQRKAEAEPKETFGATLVGGKPLTGQEFVSQPFAKQVSQAFVQTLPKDFVDFFKYIPKAEAELASSGLQGLGQIGTAVGKPFGMKTGLVTGADLNVPGVGKVSTIQNQAKSALESPPTENKYNVPFTNTPIFQPNVTKNLNSNKPFGWHAFLAPVLQTFSDGLITESALKQIVNTSAKIFGDAPASSLITGDFSQAKPGLIQKIPGAIQEHHLTAQKNAIASAQQTAVKDWAKPTEVPVAGYKKSTEIYNNALDKGHNIGETLTKNKVYLSENITQGKYDTLETADFMRQDAGQASRDILRPALEAANPSVQYTPVEDVISQAKNNIGNSKYILPEDKLSLITNLDKTENALKIKYPDGMSLTDLLDEKILRDANAKYSPIGDIAANAKAEQNKALADVLRNSLNEKAPSNIPIKEFNAELQKQYQAADYLESLHTKKVPLGIGQKIANSASKVVGAGVGSHGGIMGGVGGYHIGGMVENILSSIPGAYRDSLLKNLEQTNPEVFAQVQEALSQMVAENATRLALPAPGQTSQGITALPEPGVLKGQANLAQPINANLVVQKPVDLEKLSKQVGAKMVVPSQEEITTYLKDVPSNLLSKVDKITITNVPGFDEITGKYINGAATTHLVNGRTNIIINPTEFSAGVDYKQTLFHEILHANGYSEEKLGTSMLENIIEKVGGWKPGLRVKFDTALINKNASVVKKLLPQIPKEYANRFAKEIQKLIGG